MAQPLRWSVSCRGLPATISAELGWIYPIQQMEQESLPLTPERNLFCTLIDPGSDESDLLGG
jgi:hypothetical protein